MNPNPTGTSTPADSEGDTDFIAVLDILIEGRWLIAAIALGVFIVGVAYAVFSLSLIHI